MTGKYKKFENETNADGEPNERDTFPESESQIGVPETSQLHSDNSSSKQQGPAENVSNASGAAAADSEAPPEYSPGPDGPGSHGVNGTYLQGQAHPGYAAQYSAFPYGNIPIAPGVAPAASFSLQPVLQLAYQPQGPFPTDSEPFRVREEAQARGISTPYELLSQRMRDDIRQKVLREQCPECGKFGSFKAEWTALFFIMVALMVAVVLIGLSILLLCVVVVMVRLGYFCGCAYGHEGECGCMGKYRRRRCKECGHIAGDKRLKLMTALFALLLLIEAGCILGFYFYINRPIHTDTDHTFENSYESFTATSRGRTYGYGYSNRHKPHFQKTTTTRTAETLKFDPFAFTDRPIQQESSFSNNNLGFDFDLPKFIAPTTGAPQPTTQWSSRNIGRKDLDQIVQDMQDEQQDVIDLANNVTIAFSPPTTMFNVDRDSKEDPSTTFNL